MRVLSLFDGISCGQVALERAGIPIEVYYASEIDKYAIQITQKNYPDTIQLGDVEKIDFRQFEGEIDLLIGGSPCTNLSIAGNRKGLEGNESRLFWEYVRAIKECKPRYFLLENVESMTDSDREIISQELGCYPIMINSLLVSAQFRKRYYWFNWGNQQINLFGFPTCDIPQPENKGILLKDVLESGYGVAVEERGTKLNYSQNKASCLMARDYKGFGNQRMTGVAEPIRVGQIGKGGQGQRIYAVKGKSVSLTANGGGQGAKTGLYKIDLPDGEYLIRKLSPLECERLQTLPDRYTEYGTEGKISNTQRYKAIGNGWTVDVIAYIFSFLASV